MCKQSVVQWKRIETQINIEAKLSKMDLDFVY